MSAALSGCVTSLQSSIQLLGSSISILDTGVNDYPRLSKVLQTTRHFELLPESTLSSAQASLLASITPEIQSLLSRVETHLERLQRREQTLRAKSELLAGRLDSQSTSQPRSSSRGAAAKPWQKRTNSSASTSNKARVTPATSAAAKNEEKEVDEREDDEDLEAGREALRMKQLRQKKERLSFAVERLQLQAQHKERQLRKSMAAPDLGEADDGEE